MTMRREEHPYPYEDRAELMPFVPNDARRILDVGCSSGGFGAALKAERPHISIIGLEPNAAAADAARSVYDEVLVGAFPAALTPGSTFDLICFNDVLEHMVDPWEALSVARKWLAPDGRILASIPNVRSLRVLIDLVVRGRWSYTTMGLLDRTHLRFFTKRSIEDLFRETGYQVEQLAGLHPLATRFRASRLTTLVLRDIAFLEFAVVARPTTR